MADEVPETIISGALTVHCWRGEALVNGQPVKLSRYQFRVLRYMVQHPDRIVSRAELTKAIYDDQDRKFSDGIYGMVHRLRVKIGPGVIRLHERSGFVFGAVL